MPWSSNATFLVELALAIVLGVAFVLVVAGRAWPARVRGGRAARLGLTPDPDFDSIIRMHLAESRPGGNGSR